MGKKLKITEEQLKRLVSSKQRLQERWGSYDTISGWEDELETAVKKLQKVTPEMYKNLSPEDNQRVSKVLSSYDDNVYDYIMDWVYSGDVTADDVAQLAYDNDEEFGTEPQFVIFAIDDFCEVFGIGDYDDENEEEDSQSDYEMNDSSTRGQSAADYKSDEEEESMNSQLYESIRNNFKRFL
jgi:hypothetical protein